MAFTAVFAAASLVGINEAKKREKRQVAATEKAARVESAQRANEARKARRAQVREARQIQAEQQNLAAVGGQTGSSAAVAAKGSVAASLGTNLGDISTSLALGEAQTQAELDIFKAGKRSDVERISGLVTSVSGSFAGKG